MKRIVCIVLAVMMLAGVCGAAAESKESTRNDRKVVLNVLEQAYESYELAPAAFDLELTIYTFAFYKMFMLNEVIGTVGSKDSFEQLLGEGFTAEFMKTALSGHHQLLTILDEDYEKWLNREIELAEFREELMPIVKGILENYKDK